MIVSVTGHRPSKLKNGYSKNTHIKLISIASTWMKNYFNDIERIYTGMALGWDTAVAKTCAYLNVPFVACIPFKGQEKKWSPADKDSYYSLLELASEIVYVDELEQYQLSFSQPGEYHIVKLQKRNEYMIDQLQSTDILLALWNKENSGGTYNCIKYAKNKNVNLINLWEDSL